VSQIDNFSYYEVILHLIDLQAENVLIF